MEACDWILIFGVLIHGVWIGFAIGATVAENSTSQRWMREVIEHGAASYEITDPVTGATELRWKEKPDAP